MLRFFALPGLPGSCNLCCWPSLDKGSVALPETWIRCSVGFKRICTESQTCLPSLHQRTSNSKVPDSEPFMQPTRCAQSAMYTSAWRGYRSSEGTLARTLPVPSPQNCPPPKAPQLSTKILSPYHLNIKWESYAKHEPSSRTGWHRMVDQGVKIQLLPRAAANKGVIKVGV